MNIITQLYNENFAGKIGKWCREHGVMYIGHVVEDNNAHVMTGNGAGHYFRAIAGQDMSGVDVVLHQIIPGLTEYSNTGEVCYKQMNNKFFHYILAKLASGAADIQENKHGRAMCEIFGAYGWGEGTKIMEYQNRMCHLLNGGKYRAACALVYDAETRWSAKEFCPSEDVAKLLYDNQIDYDIVSFDDLDRCDKYPVIIMPYTSYVSDDNYDKLKKLGSRVISTGECGVKDLAFVPLIKLTGFMEEYRQLYIESGYDKFIRYCHYCHDDAELYVINNENIKRDADINIKIKDFDGGFYIVYDAFENKAVQRYSESGMIELKVYPYNEIVIIIPKTAELDEISSINDDVTEECELNCKFDIEICTEENLPFFEMYKSSDTLMNITGKYELPHFSGNIKYKTVFDADNFSYNILDLGYVGETAEVILNGKNIGVRLFPPYKFDISDAVKSGKNNLEIIVTNSYGYKMRDIFSKWMMFEPSGLIGPIKLR